MQCSAPDSRQDSVPGDEEARAEGWLEVPPSLSLHCHTWSPLGFPPLRLSALGRQDAVSPYPIGHFHEPVPLRILQTPEEMRVGANQEMLTLGCGLS